MNIFGQFYAREFKAGDKIVYILKEKAITGRIVSISASGKTAFVDLEGNGRGILPVKNLNWSLQNEDQRLPEHRSGNHS